MAKEHWDPIPEDADTFSAEASYLGRVNFQWGQFGLGLFLWWGIYLQIPRIAELLPWLLGSWMLLVLVGGILWRNPRGGFLCAVAPSVLLGAAIIAFRHSGDLLHLLWFVSGSGVLGVAGILLGARIRRHQAFRIRGNRRFIVLGHPIDKRAPTGERLQQIDRTVDLGRLRTTQPRLLRRVRVPSTSPTS
jgi:hypothetical protein